MGGRKKKPWINKRTAATFRIVHRNYQDPLWGTENRSDYVLEPVANLNALKKGILPPTIEQASELLATPEQEPGPPPEEKLLPIEAYGFPDDGYDYSKHLKPMGGGTFIPAEVEASGELFGLSPLAEDVESQHVIGGSEKFLPDDVLELLHGEYEENDLQDDFVVIADASCSEDEEYGDDYESGDDDLPPPLEPDFDPQEERFEPRGEFAHGTKDKNRKLIYVSNLQNFNSTLDQQFDKIAADYDDDEIGELDEADPSVKGVMDLSDLGYILDEFLEENSREKIKMGSERLIPSEVAANIPRDYDAIDVEENDEEPEDLLDGYEYLSAINQPQGEQWDCESILSTYSNLYNHPTVVDEPKKKIKLSKRGLPVDYIGKPKRTEEQSDDEEDDEDDCISTTSTNFGERRPPKETAEEKRARKQAVKEMRKMRRQEKKEMRTQFKKEEVRQVSLQITTKNPVGLRL